MVEVERAGLFIQHELDKVLENLRIANPERNAHIIAQIEEARHYLDGQYSEFNFVYGKESLLPISSNGACGRACPPRSN